VKSPQTLEQKIVNARRLYGITQKELAIRLGIDPGTLSNWEKGRGRPSAELLEIMYDFFASLAPGALKPEG